MFPMKTEDRRKQPTVIRIDWIDAHQIIVDEWKRRCPFLENKRLMVEIVEDDVNGCPLVLEIAVID